MHLLIKKNGRCFFIVLRAILKKNLDNIDKNIDLINKIFVTIQLTNRFVQLTTLNCQFMIILKNDKHYIVLIKFTLLF